MEDFLSTFGAFLAMISILVFVISFFMLFFESKRKLGLKLMIWSVITFIIGFGACMANI